MGVEEVQYESIQEDELKGIEDEVMNDDSNQIFASPLCEDDNLVTCTFSQTLRPLDDFF